MKQGLYTILLAITSVCCNGQLYDATWSLGYLPISTLTFNADSVILDSINSPYYYFLTNANICDENGTFLYTTNGICILDKNGDTLQNGTGINPCDYTKQHACCGLNIPQAALFIPQPGNNKYYYLFHFSNDDADSSRPATIYYSIIDKEGNGGLGAVIEKNDTLFHTTILRGGGMTACKHANGRDYWLIMGASVINTFYKFLITPDGVEGPFTQNIGPEFPGAFDNAYSRFSQDGSKFVTGVYEGPILVMDFDRCSGEFSNPVTIFNQGCDSPQSCSASVSVEFSSNNRFVYISDVINLNQYDLWAPNIQDSMVQIYAINNMQTAEFDMLELAPNGKIYLSTWNGVIGFDSIHVINNPNEKGDSCNFVYGGQPIEWADGIGLPNMINYRLGALVGSGCDTLTDIINDPVVEKSDIRVYPNPAKELLNLAYYVNATGNVEFDLIDELGEPVIQQTLGSTQTFAQFSTSNLSNGLYYWELKDSERTIKTGKVAIMK